MFRISARAGLLVGMVSLMGCDRANPTTNTESASTAPTTPAPAAPAPAPVTQVTFTKKIPQSGTRALAKRTSSSKFTMADKTFRETQTLVSQLTVKESDEFRITKAGIDVQELFTTSQQGTGTESRSVSPLAGSSYVVSRNDDGKLSALNSAGNKVPASTLKLLQDEFASTFEKNHDAAFLPDRPLKLDEKLMPPSDAMLTALGIKDDGNTLIDGTEFILTRIGDDKVSFDVSLTMTQKVSGLRVRAKLAGSMDVRPDGAWIVGADLKGPITILDGSGNEKGSGELSISASQTLQ